MPMLKLLQSAVILLAILVIAGCGGDQAFKPRPKRKDDDAKPTDVATATAPGKKGEPEKAAEEKPVAVDFTKINWRDPMISLPVGMKLTEEQCRERTMLQLAKIHQIFEEFRKREEKYFRPVYQHPKTGGPALSWRVMMLKLMGYPEMFLQFSTSEGWDGPHNRKLLKKIPGLFQAAHRLDEKTNFKLVVGPEAFFANPYLFPETESSIDGLQNTLAIVEVSDDQACVWTKPEDYTYDPTTAFKDLFSLRKDCCFALVGAETGLRQIPANIPDPYLKALMTSSGGEKVKAVDLTLPASAKVNRDLIAAVAKARESIVATPATDPAANGGAGMAATGSTTTGGPTVASHVPNYGGAAPGLSSDKEKPADKGSDTATEKGNGANVIQQPLEPPDTRLSVPSDEALAEASQLVKKIFGDEYAAAKTPELQRQFARKLLAEAEKQGLDISGHYVLLRAAKEIATTAGDTVAAFSAADKMTATYKIDHLETYLTILEKTSNGLRSAQDANQFMERALGLKNLALQKDDYAGAKQVLALATKVAKKLGRADIVAQINAASDHLQEQKKANADVADHALRLLQAPHDPHANFSLGKYICYVKGDWMKGLPMLAKGSQETVKAIARDELQLASESPNDRVELANRWWDYSDTLAVPGHKIQVRLHAADLYASALKNLENGLARSLAEKRVAEMKNFPRPVVSSDPPWLSRAVPISSQD